MVMQSFYNRIANEDFYGGFKLFNEHMMNVGAKTQTLHTLDFEPFRVLALKFTSIINVSLIKLSSIKDDKEFSKLQPGVTTTLAYIAYFVINMRIVIIMIC